MPICKNCHHSISSFDKDVCPYCGENNPIDENYETKDMTQFVDPVSGDYKLYKSKSRKASAFLCLFLGYFGAHSFYLGFYRRGAIEAIASLLIIGGIGSLLGFLLQGKMPFYLPHIILFAVLFLVYAILSIRYFHKDSLKDSRGEFLH